MKACPACNTRYEDNFTFCTKDGTPVVLDLAAPKAAGLENQVIDGRYRILKKLGEGGMGEVYVVEHVHIEKKFALKLLRAEVLANAEAVTRFRQEARSASSIGHENIVGIDDFGELPDKRVYMAMEYLVGSPLNDMLAAGPIDIGRGLDIMISTCRGLAAAHAKGIIHRDMKPENIFVTHKDGRDVPKILDFGIAKVSQGDQAQNLTQAGTIYGTPFYMAPEQAMGMRMDHRVDVYAMGIILYEMFTGTLPFKGETFMGILSQHITMNAVPPSAMAGQHGRSCPLPLEQVIMKAIAKEPAERYQTMNDLAMALTDVYRALIGPRATGAMAPMPIGSSQFQAYQTAGMTAATAHSGAMPAPAQAKKGKTGLIVGVVIGIAALGGGGAAWYFTVGPGHTQTAKEGPETPPPVVAGSSEAAKIPTPPPITPPTTPPASSAAVTSAPAIIASATPDAGVHAEITPPVTPPNGKHGSTPDKGHKLPPGVTTSSSAVAVITPPPVTPTSSAPVVTPPVTPANEDKSVVVLVDSFPHGADVYRDGSKVGTTPVNVTMKESESATFTFKKDGFKDASSSWNASKGAKVRGHLDKIHPDEGDELKKYPADGTQPPTPPKPPDDDGLAVPKVK